MEFRQGYANYSVNDIRNILWRLQNWPLNWNGEGALPLSRENYREGLLFFDQLNLSLPFNKSNEFVYTMYPTPEGGLVFEIFFDTDRKRDRQLLLLDKKENVIITAKYEPTGCFDIQEFEFSVEKITEISKEISDWMKKDR